MFANPKHVLAQIGVSPGATIVDFGSGVGHYALVAAQMVAQGMGAHHEGKVYAVEVQKTLLDRLQIDAKHQGIHNIHVIWGDFEKPNGTKLKTHCADVGIISNVLFQIEHRKVFSEEVARVIKSSGRILCVDWIRVPLGTPKNQQISKADMLALFEAVGFVFEKDVSVGSQHYGVILRKK